ncbi:hypothetical protein LXL04_030817 [Taraxacum kok-saghyz]
MSSSWYARATMERDGLVLAGSHMGIGRFFDMYRGEILRMVYSKWRYSLWWKGSYAFFFVKTTAGSLDNGVSEPPPERERDRSQGGRSISAAADSNRTSTRRRRLWALQLSELRR